MINLLERYSSPSAAAAAAATAVEAGMAAVAARVEDAAGRDDGWTFPRYDPILLKGGDNNKRAYFGYFMDFMTFFHHSQGKSVSKYPLDKVFTRAQLQQ